MSDGFNPHPRLSFPLPLGVGAVGSDEAMEFELADWVPAPEILRRLRASAPCGLEIRSAELAPPGKPARACETTYVVRPRDVADLPPWLAQDRLQQLLDRSEVVVERTRKAERRAVNIRPFLLDLHAERNSVAMRFRVDPSGTARPEEVLKALGCPPDQCHALFDIERTLVLLV